jgi:hypothetical protein
MSQPTPSGSKKRHATQRGSESEDDPATPIKSPKTPKKPRQPTKATPRNKSLWDHFKIDPDVPQGQQTKSTKVCNDVK